MASVDGGAVAGFLRRFIPAFSLSKHEQDANKDLLASGKGNRNLYESLRYRTVRMRHRRLIRRYDSNADGKFITG